MLTYYITAITVFILSLAAERVYRSGVQGLPEKRKNTGFLFFAICIAAVLIFVSGFRWYVGSDYGGYYRYYADYANEWRQSIIEFDEPGLRVIAKIASLVYDDGVTLILFMAALTIGLYMWTIGKNTDASTFMLAVMLYLFVGAWHGSFNGVRQYAAAAILFAGHRLILKRKFWQYLLIVFIAMLFHKTAVIMLPFYFIANRKVNLKTILIIVLVTLVLRYSYDSIIEFVGFLKGEEIKQTEYLLNDVKVLRVIVNFMPILLALFMRSQGIRFDEDTKFYFMLCIMNAAFSYITSGSAYLARAGIYTEIYMAMFYAKASNYFTKRSRILYSCVLLLCFAAYWYYSIDKSEALNQFRWIFNK